MKYYISDLHLQHNGILKYDSRPFDNIDEHDKAVIDIINKTVGKDDSLYILGDIAWKGNKALDDLGRIKCKNIFFTPGNHDFSKYVKLYENKLGWTNLGLMYIDKDAKVVLSHYPIHERYKSNHRPPDKYIHIHGHSHGRSPKKKGRIDVGFTFKDIKRPLSINEVRDVIDSEEKEVNSWLKRMLLKLK